MSELFGNKARHRRKVVSAPEVCDACGTTPVVRWHYGGRKFCRDCSGKLDAGKLSFDEIAIRVAKTAIESLVADLMTEAIRVTHHDMEDSAVEHRWERNQLKKKFKAVLKKHGID